MSENPRPASTPPTLASGEKDEGDVEKIVAELEVQEIISSALCLLYSENCIAKKQKKKKTESAFFGINVVCPQCVT